MAVKPMRDPRFTTGELVRLTAAVAGISRKGWTALRGRDAREDDAKALMAKERFDVLPIETEGSVQAYFHTLKWNDYSQVSRATVREADLLPYNADLREVVRCLVEQSRLFFFLADGGDVVGLVSVVNLNRRPVKVWLFNLLSEVEVRLGEFLCRHCKDEDIYELTLGRTTEAKYDQVKARYQTDRKNGLELPIVEYLYFPDLLGVVLSKSLYEQLGYTQTSFKRSLGSLADLRDVVAHPTRSLIREPQAVSKLWRRVQRIEDTLERLRRSLTTS